MIQTTVPKFSWFKHVSKGVAVIASTGAALVSIVTALYSYGVIGNRESHQTIGNYGAAWVKLRPSIDTATAIGDTVHFAATVADRKGSILVGAEPTWTTGDSTVATVTPDGSVIAQGPGLTTVSVVVGELVSNARILVKQQVAAVDVANPAGDTAVSMLEGNQIQLHARALDSRGHTVAGRVAQWHIDDSSVATVDARGFINALNAGRSVVSANVDGSSGYLPIAVVTPASSIAVVAGSSQRTLAGHLLPQRIVVRAINRRGAPAVGKTVTFRLGASQGKVDPATAVTDADGRARVQWTLGDDPGLQTLLATVENVDSAAVVEAEADPVPENTRIVKLTETLRARAGYPVGDSVGIRVTDSTGRALVGVPVRWTAVNGVVEAVSARTDSTGVARARWTLGPSTGAQRVRVSVGASDSRIPPATLVATALAGAPANLIVVSGDRQKVAAGRDLKDPVVLRVVDAAGNGAADVPVVLSPSGGAVSDTAVITDSLGIVKTVWTMGHSAGDYTLAAHIDGIKKLFKVTAHATAAGAANLSFDDAPAKGARAGTRRLVALVTDIYGNPVSDSPVSFTVKTGAVTPARAVTDSKGRVAISWMMGTAATEQKLSGTVRGTDVTGAYVAQVKAPSTAKVAQAGKAVSKPPASKPKSREP